MHPIEMMEECMFIDELKGLAAECQLRAANSNDRLKPKFLELANRYDTILDDLIMFQAGEISSCFGDAVLQLTKH